MGAKISALFIYPVKGCRGIALPLARVTERGLARDREWMVVDVAGRFVTQRTEPRLASITTAITATALELGAPGAEPLQIPLDHAGIAGTVTVWGDTVPCIDQGPAAAAWLSARLNGIHRLVRFDPAARRRCNPEYAGASGAHTAFADGYPLLVLSEASLDDLNGRLAAPLRVDRFRPNLLLSGIDAYDEDYIDEIVSGEVALKMVKPCTRCEVTTIDQQTLERGAEPLRTLAGYRHNALLDGIAFGMNAIVAAGAGATLARAAPVTYSYRF
ncbi:MAG: MOSC N-terminal beta barrel domain-containing protein [Betaproteobacteria bacterium]